MAEHQATALDLQLTIVLDAGPAGQRAHCRRVAIAGDEMLRSMQRGPEQRRGSGRRTRTAKSPRCQTVSPGPTVIVPALDQRLVHRRNRGERAPEQAQRTAMAEMGVAGEEGPAQVSCSRRRGMSSAKLQGRCRMSSWMDAGSRPSRRGRRRASRAGRRCRCRRQRRRRHATAGTRCRSSGSSASGTARRSRRCASRPPRPGPRG